MQACRACRVHFDAQVCVCVGLKRGTSCHACLSFSYVPKLMYVGARQAKKDSPLENPMVDRTSQVLVWGSVVGTVVIAAVSL